MNLRFTENVRVFCFRCLVCHVHTFLLSSGHSQLLVPLLHVVLLQPPEWTMQDIRSWLVSLGTHELEHVQCSFPCPYPPIFPLLSPPPCHSLVPRPSEEAASHKLPSGQCAGVRGLHSGATCVWGGRTEVGGWLSVPSRFPWCTSMVGARCCG